MTLTRVGPCICAQPPSAVCWLSKVRQRQNRLGTSQVLSESNHHVKNCFSQCAFLLTLLVSALYGFSQQPQTPQKHFSLGTPVKAFTDKDGALTTRDIAGHRDLATYDKAGHFDCRQYTKHGFEAKPSSCLDAARSFIWTHWQRKKRGYLRITLNSVDATSTSHIFIEADQARNWQITWRIVRNDSMLQHSVVNDVPVIRELEQKQSGSKIQLIFKSADGIELETL